MRACAWGFLALLCVTTNAAADPVAQIVKLSGTAAVTRDGATAPLVLGAALEAGDKLTTDATGRLRLQLIDGSVINLGSQSELLIDDVVSGGPGTERQISLELDLGALLAKAAPATPSSRFEIRTTKAVSAVRGTEWGIRTTSVQSDILVLEGRVGVRKNEISGKSAISLTRTLGVTVTDQGLGQITRWKEPEVTALLDDTTVPGAEMGFDLGKAPALNLAPATMPVTPGTPPTQKNKKACQNPADNECDNGRSRDHDRDHDHDSQSHDHDSST
jgi:hypothetical protein